MNRTCGSSKPTPTPLNGLAFEGRKKAKKVIEGDADTIRRQTIRQNLPRTASVAGGGETKKALWQDQPPSEPSRESSAWRGGRDEERRIEGQHRREDKENQSQNPPAGYHRGGGGETRGENQHKMERWHNPQSREGGGAKLKTHLKRENKTTCITKKRRQNIQSCATV